MLIVAVVSLDIRGAFDYVFHHKVIGELLERGTALYLVELIQDYFRGRRVQWPQGLA